MTTLADELLAVALGLERGDSVPASAGRRLRAIAERVRAMELDAAGPVPDRRGMDGTARLCRALYGRKERPADYLGGSDARMLHDAADRLTHHPCRDGWHKIPPYGYVPDEAQAPYVAGPVAEEPE